MPSAEASLYALLGRLFAAEIDLDLLAILQSHGIQESFDAIEPGCLDQFDQESAAAEFCRLFVLPNGVPAVAAAWLPGSDPNKFAAIAGLVLNLQSKLDLSLPAELPLDHAGTLLPIMAWLLENQSETAGDFQRIALDPWLGQFASALGEMTELPIYRAIAAILTSLHGEKIYDRFSAC